MMIVALWTLSAVSALPVFADVSKDDILKLLAAHASEETVIGFVRANAPVRMLSTQDILDLRNAGASEKVISALSSVPLTSGESTIPMPEQAIPAGPDYVLESPEYYPYYYEYYPHYTPYFYTYPGFSFYFYWPFFYHRHHFVVRAFPYYGHEGWRYHHAFPYHAGTWGYHPWYDHQGFHAYHPHGGGPRGEAIREAGSLPGSGSGHGGIHR